MKKTVFFACLLAATAAMAGMNNRAYNLQVEGTNTVEQSMFVYGEVASVVVTVPEGATGSIALAGGGETLLSLSGTTNSATYHPVVPSCGSDGAAISNAYQRPGLACPLTCTVTGTGTNTVTYSVNVFFVQ